MASHRLARIEIDDLEIIGYSMAGEETVVAVPQLDVCFDIGKAPDQTISINHVLLSHGHMDHAAGIAYYLSHRNFDGQAPGTVLAPRNLIPSIQQVIDGWSGLDGNRIPAQLKGVIPGDEYAIKSNLITRVFPTDHCYGSVGYTILEKRTKLKSQYTGLAGPELVKLKQQGIQIERPIEIPLVTYLGDTQCAPFAQLDYVANSKILIAECTFYEQDHVERARAGKHMHVNDFIPLIEGLNNEHVIITHTTQRTGLNIVSRILRQALPEKIAPKVQLLMERRRPAR